MKILSVDKDKMIDKRLKKMADESRYSFAELKAIMDSILEKKIEEAFDKLKAIILAADQYSTDQIRYFLEFIELKETLAK